MAASDPIRGITRTTSDTQPPIRSSIANQSTSFVLFVVTLLPPLILILVRALSGAARTIPYAALWAWGALILAILLLVRAGTTVAASPRANALTSLTGPILLFTVALVVFILRLRLYPTPLPLAIAQIVVYCLCAFSVLLSPTQGLAAT